MKRVARRSLIIAILVVVLLTLTVSVAFASSGTYHRVHYGETLFSIGRYYGVNPYYIADVNNLYNPNYIYAGQVLYIPASGYYDGCQDPCYDSGYWDDSYRYRDHGYHDGSYMDYDYGHHDGSYVDYDYGYDCGMPSNHHVVRYGETLSSIAYYYGVSPWALAKTNHIYNMHRIYAGQVLYIPSGGHCNTY